MCTKCDSTLLQMSEVRCQWITADPIFPFCATTLDLFLDCIHRLGTASGHGLPLRTKEWGESTWGIVPRWIGCGGGLGATRVHHVPFSPGGPEPGEDLEAHGSLLGGAAQWEVIQDNLEDASNVLVNELSLARSILNQVLGETTYKT